MIICDTMYIYIDTVYSIVMCRLSISTFIFISVSNCICVYLRIHILIRCHLTISIHGHFEPKLGGSPFSGTAVMCWMVAGWLLVGKWGHYDFKHLIIWYQGALIIRKANQSGCDLFRHPCLKPLDWNVLIATQSR